MAEPALQLASSLHVALQHMQVFDDWGFPSGLSETRIAG